MFYLTSTLPHDFYVAVSGGVDSMAALSFFSNRRHKPRAAFFHHGTEFSQQGAEFVSQYCKTNGLDFKTAKLSTVRPAGISPEEHWRNERYKFFHGLGLPVITAHHLDDVIETWIFTSLHGQSKLIPYQNQNVIRPFRATPKLEMRKWCERHNVPWIEDPSNLDLKYARNRIRHCIVPEALQINPGLGTVLRKKILAENLEQKETK